MSKEEDSQPVIKFSIKLIEMLSKFQEIELEDVELDVDDLEIWIQPSVSPPHLSPRTVPNETVSAKVKPTMILTTQFQPPITQYPGQIVEVKLGATKSEGGTRGTSFTIGGEKAPAFSLFESEMPHPPIISFDIFDTKIPLAKAVKMHVQEVMEDPAAWAKLSVDKFDADMVNLHLTSIDPLREDTSPREAAKTVEAVLQAVDVPIAVGGCGDPEKDLQVFEKVAEIGEGERLLINSVTLDMDIKRMAECVKRYGHRVIAFTSMDMAHARELNRRLYEFLERDRIVIDTTTAALGYGLDYAFTIMERTRLAALMGDPELQHPMSSGTTNAWAAREAWMKMDPKWGPRELRGPIWETVTALSLLLTGVDYFMMMHPAAVKTVKNVISKLTSRREVHLDSITDWITLTI